MESHNEVPGYFCTLLFQKIAKEPTKRQRQFVEDLLQSSFEGHFCITGPENELEPLKGLLIEEIVDPSLSATLPICSFKGLYYLHRNWHLERAIAEGILALSERCLDPIELQHRTAPLNEKQGLALSLFARSSWMLLSGGPGRGKTFTAAALVKSLPANLKILVAAPTGKATWHLFDQIKKVAPSHLVEAATLHSLLHSLKAHQKIKHDVIIVDEASMIDAIIFHRFLDKIGPTSRLLLMGDVDQLPPVETGMVFADLFLFAKESGKIPYVELTHCYRSDRQDILTLAEQINHQTLCTPFQIKEPSALEKENLLTLAERYYRFEGDNLEEAKLRFSEFRILTSLQVGPWGARALNQSIHDHLQKMSSQSLMFPILITKTHYQLGIFNGETGFVLGNKVYLPKEKEWLSLPVPVIPSYELAYAMTVHKSQGSEYDHVILVLPEGSENFGKELIYTGVTRSRKKIEIISTREIFEAALSKKSERRSSLTLHLDV
jgi:exodeoxyribonuclease V alpha subunit